MKKIVKEIPPQNTISLAEIINSDIIDPTKKYYGALVTETSKAFVTQEKFESGQYVLRSPHDITIGNGWHGYENICLERLLNDILHDGVELFVFDTGNELFKWLAE